MQVAGRADELAGIKHADADVVLFSLEHIEDFAEDRHLRPVNRRQAQIERLPRPLLLLRLRRRNRSRRKIGIQRTGKVTHELRCLFIAHGQRARDINDLSLL